MSTPDDSHFDPDDPRLTAYALGELPDPADRAQVEAVLAASPEARAELADIRALSAALTAEYEQDRVKADGPAGPTPSNVIRLPKADWTWVRPWLAAAAVLFLVALGYSSLPVFNSVQVKGSRLKKETARAETELATEPAVKAAAPTGAAQEHAFGLRDNSNVALAKEEKPAPSFDRPGASTSVDSRYSVRVRSLSDEPAPLLAQAAEVSQQDSLVSQDTKHADGPTTSRLITRSINGALDFPAGTTAAPAMPASAPSGTVSAVAAPPAIATILSGVFSVSSHKTDSAGAAEADDVTRFANLKDAKAMRRPAAGFNTAAYDHVTETPFLAAKDNPLSTFSVDVDTASYSIVRRFIEGGSLPPPGAVRIEEMLNYFPYDYTPPAPGDERPFAIHLEGAACPWSPDHRLIRVALKGREMAQDKRPPSNLVFLIDVSGSMEPSERLPLIKESLRLLVEKLTDNDHVAIVVYAGHSGLVLPSTNGAHKDTILGALGRLEAGGSTNGASGIQLAYKVAQQGFIKGGTNRVILATDGDFNVGTTSQAELVRLIEKEAKGGVFLTCLGVGTDNLKDSTMQKLADHGNGNYAYLDRLDEGKKVLVEQMSGTLVTIAKDVKIQVEFNPAAVQSYRLIGYEKRLLRKEDFNDDRVDAGEIGAGHSVTALYEVVPAGQTDAGAAPTVDALKYQATPEAAAVRTTTRSTTDAREMLTVKIRHKAPDSDTSDRSYEAAFVDHGADYANATPDFKFAAAVASFGLVLRESPYKGNATLGAAIELAQEGKGTDATGYRAGFIELARRAQALSSTR